MKHVGDITLLDGAKLEPVDVITGGSPCFPEGTLVLTEDGYIPIEDVKVGDQVLTHMGRWRTVLATGSKLGRTVLLKGNHYGLECTPNHPIYSSGEKKYYPQLGNGKRGNTMHLTEEKSWIPAGEMSGKLWAVPNRVEELPIGFPSSAQQQTTKPMPQLTEDLLYFVGRWLGDGWVVDGQRSNRPKGQRYGRVFLCDSLDKEDELRRTVEMVTDNYHLQHNDSAVKIEFTSRVLCDWLTNNFGKYAYGKTMPGWVFGLQSTFRQSLLDGILDSDGCPVKEKDNAWKVSTVGKKLAESVRLLAETLGYSTTVHKVVVEKSRLLNGRIVNQRDWYQVVITLGSKRKHLSDDSHGWYRVRSVEPTDRITTVYNLTVDEDNSYVADGIVVHNCQDLSVAGKRAGLAGARSGLYMEQIRVIREMREASGKPRYNVWENVPGAFSSNNGKDFGAVLEETIKVVEPDIPEIPMPKGGWPLCGVIFTPTASFAWRTHDAQYWGVPQRRRRICVLSDYDGHSAPYLLFEKLDQPTKWQKKGSKLPYVTLELTTNIFGDVEWTEASGIDMSYFNITEKPITDHTTKLSQVLEKFVALKYYLSAKACRGILTRAARRGKELPEELRIALETQAAEMENGRENGSEETGDEPEG